MSRSSFDTRDPRSAPPPEPLGDQFRDLMERVASHGMTKVALVAFVFGIFLHVAVIYAVLGESKGRSNDVARPLPAAGGSQPAVAVVTPTPIRSSDRTSCDSIRGTDYRSETERLWFKANCS
jgi:hypothetical protein